MQLLHIVAFLHLFYFSCRWDQTREFFAAIFKQKTQAEWSKVFDGTDACVTPVLRPEQLHQHPLHIARLAVELAALVQFLTLRLCRGTFEKGGTAVAPAPILHELHDGSKSSTPNDQSGPSIKNANFEGLLAVKQTRACLTLSY